MAASDRVVRGHILSTPHFAGRPVRRGSRPEFVRRGQPEGKQAGRTKVHTPGRDVAFADVGLVPAEADGEPTVAVEAAGRLDHPTHPRRPAAAHLRPALTAAFGLTIQAPRTLAFDC